MATVRARGHAKNDFSGFLVYFDNRRSVFWVSVLCSELAASRTSHQYPPPVQGASVDTPQVNAQIVEPAVHDGEIKIFSGRTPEYLEAYEKRQAWEKKAEEIRAKISQVSQEFFDALPETEEEIERYKTDKEWQRRVRETRKKRMRDIG